MKEIRLIVRSRERNTESTEMDWNLKETEKKINEIVERINEETEDRKHLWDNLIALQKEVLKIK